MEPAQVRRWDGLPEASRQAAVRWLAVIVGKAIGTTGTPAGPAAPASPDGEP